jgi:lipoprotein-anchoring transpeptidase ErfK/SrfK
VHLINWKYAEKAAVLLTATHTERIAKKQGDEAGKCPQISVISRYTFSEEDVTGPYDRHIQRGLEQMARFQGLSYRSPLEELSEKFHMSEDLLRTLNPGADFDRAGTTIVVADVRPLELRHGAHTIEAARPKSGETQGQNVATIVVDKPAREVRAYGKDGKLLAFYPATIGSEENPAPSGSFKVRRVAWNPDYHYNPKFAWKRVKTKRELTIRPGPNNLVWIDLTAPSYGIHGHA